MFIRSVDLDVKNVVTINGSPGDEASVSQSIKIKSEASNSLPITICTLESKLQFEKRLGDVGLGVSALNFI